MKRLVRTALLTAALFLLFAVPALAQAVTPPADTGGVLTPADLGALFDQLKSFAALPGFVALVAVVVGAAKQAKLVSDGDAGKWSLILNLAGAAGLFWYVQAGGSAEHADSLFGEAAQIGAAIVALILQVGGSKLVYLVGKWAGVPVLGKSLTPPAA